MIKNLLNKLLATTPTPEPTTPSVIVQQQKIYLFETNQYELEQIIESPDLCKR